ncbi:MAG: thioredoxin family protein [Kiritimatiellaeota bacterium]|nr:thioredoxin family protein [Kiritimatiellota bacterium]
MKKTWMIGAVVGMVAASCFAQATPATAKPVTTGSSVKPGVWTQDVDAAKELAQEKGLPLFLNFTGSDWCGWCKLMESQVFSTPEWKRYAKDNLVLVTIDFPQNKSLVPAKYVERNKALQTEYKVSGYPTYILVSSDGTKRLGKLGASREATPQTFIASVNDLLKPERIAKLGEEDKAAYDGFLAEQAAIKAEYQAWLDTKPNLKNALEKRKQDDFQKRIAAVDAKINALLIK